MEWNFPQAPRQEAHHRGHRTRFPLRVAPLGPFPKDSAWAVHTKSDAAAPALNVATPRSELGDSGRQCLRPSSEVALTHAFLLQRWKGALRLRAHSPNGLRWVSAYTCEEKPPTENYYVAWVDRPVPSEPRRQARLPPCGTRTFSDGRIHRPDYKAEHFLSWTAQSSRLGGVFFENTTAATW